MTDAPDPTAAATTGLPAPVLGGPAPVPGGPGGLDALPSLPRLDAPVRRRPPPGGARREWQTATVVAVRDETARARTLRLALPDPVPHVPGQHYTVRLVADDGYVAQRSYSVATPPEPSGEVELTVERLADGEVSPFLHDAVTVGHALDVRGPFGGWFVWDGRVPALLVGGGSGVVPLAAMLRHARRDPDAAPVRAAVSARSPDELLYRDLWGEETTLVFSRTAPPGSPRAAGRMTADDLRPAVAALPDATAYVCGSAGFAEHASQLLVALGVDVGRVRVERFGASG